MRAVLTRTCRGPEKYDAVQQGVFCWLAQRDLRNIEPMPTTKPSISLSPVSLEVGGPEIGAPDLAEFRIDIRPFPKDAAERDCYRYLLEQMQATPGHPRATKGEFEKTCRRRFHVTLDSFEYCWREAIEASGPVGISPGAAPAKTFLAKPPREFFSHREFGSACPRVAQGAPASGTRPCLEKSKKPSRREPVR
jgi:hypothetical protein